MLLFDLSCVNSYNCSQQATKCFIVKTRNKSLSSKAHTVGEGQQPAMMWSLALKPADSEVFCNGHVWRRFKTFF